MRLVARSRVAVSGSPLFMDSVRCWTVATRCGPISMCPGHRRAATTSQALPTHTAPPHNRDTRSFAGPTIGWRSSATRCREDPVTVMHWNRGKVMYRCCLLVSALVLAWLVPVDQVVAPAGPPPSPPAHGLQLSPRSDAHNRDACPAYPHDALVPVTVLLHNSNNFDARSRSAVGSCRLCR